MDLAGLVEELAVGASVGAVASVIRASPFESDMSSQVAPSVAKWLSGSVASRLVSLTTGSLGHCK